MSPHVRRSIVNAVPCTRCGAAKGWDCRTPSNRLCEPHQARVESDLFKKEPKR